MFLFTWEKSVPAVTALMWKYSEFEKNIFLQFSRFPWFSHNSEFEDHGLPHQHRPIRSIRTSSHVHDFEGHELQQIGKALVASYQNTTNLCNEVSDGFKALI